MHELSIALSILDLAAEESARRGDAPVRAIHIQLGPLAGVVREALLSAFELARESSPFPAVELVVRETPVVVHCRTCNAQRAVESIQLMCCAICGTLCGQVISGRELEVTALEIEEPADAAPTALAESEGHV